MCQVDLFVNYDCDLQAANLFERTLRGISKIIRRTENAALGQMFGSAPQGPSRAKALALQALLAILQSLDAWAEPMKVVCKAKNTMVLQ